VNDNDGATSNEATLSIKVNAPPQAANDNVVFPADRPGTHLVVGNDVDSDGTIDPSTVDLLPAAPGRQSWLKLGGQGEASVNEYGAVTFTPVQGYVGTVTIPYTVNDNDGATSTEAPLSIKVNGPPQAAPDAVVIPVSTSSALQGP
jgi:hypothetical protein